MAQVLGSSHPLGGPDGQMMWRNPGFCGHLESEQVDGRLCVCVCVYLCLSNTYNELNILKLCPSVLVHKHTPWR